MKTPNPTPNRTARRAGWLVNEWCDEARIGRTRFYEELKMGRVRAKKCGSRTIVTTSPLGWLESLPDAKAAAYGDHPEC